MTGCITPGHHLSVIVPEDVINHVVGLVYDGRPQYFRRVSRRLAPADFPEPQEPIKIGETGHRLEYDIRAESLRVEFGPLEPENTSPFKLTIRENQILVRCQLSAKLQDFGGPYMEEELPPWEFALQVGFLGWLVFDEENPPQRVIRFHVDECDIVGLLPAKLEQAIEYVALKMIRSALRRVSLPAHFYADPPYNVNASIDSPIAINNELLTVRATTDLCEET